MPKPEICGTYRAVEDVALQQLLVLLAQLVRESLVLLDAHQQLLQDHVRLKGGG